MLNITTILRKRNGWVPVKLIARELGVNRTNVNRRINQMHKYGLIYIIIDGKTHLVKLKNGGPEDGTKKR